MNIELSRNTVIAVIVVVVVLAAGLLWNFTRSQSIELPPGYHRASPAPIPAAP